MKIPKETFFSHVAVQLSLILLIEGCTGHTENMKKESVKDDGIKDSTYIFNGVSLDGWEITNFGPQGPVSVSGGAVRLGIGDGCTGITFTGKVPVINYEIALEAQKVEGNDFFCGITFPVGNDFCTFIAGGWGGTTTGLSCIDGKDASENETTTMRTYEKNRWYKFIVQVSVDSIEVWIDDEKAVSLAIKGKRLSLRPEVNLSKPLGIASWNTSAGIRNIRLQFHERK